MADQSSGLAAEIVTTGTEILLGEIVDTNAAWIAQQLRDAGVNLYFKTTVGDNEARLRGVIELGLARSDAIIVTGGLGPTADDITRQAIAGAVGRPLILHEEALQTLKERFLRFGVPMTDNNVQQAYIPEGAILIENPVGTAPGFVVEVGDRAIIALPGVPHEMKRLMTDSVLPYLRSRQGTGSVIRRRVLRTVGVGESTVDRELRDLMQQANPSVGLAAHLGQVDIRLTAQAASEELVESMLAGLETEIRGRIGRHIYSDVPERPFAGIVVEMLQQVDSTVALLESNTEGHLARRLAAVPGGAGILAAHWELDDLPADIRRRLEVEGAMDPASCDEELARLLAERLRRASGATYGLVLLGSGGGDEGIYSERPGESWLGLAGPNGVNIRHVPYGGRDEFTVTRIGNSALIMLWQLLSGEG